MNAILVLGEDLRTLEKVGVSADDIARLIHEAVTSVIEELGDLDRLGPYDSMNSGAVVGGNLTVRDARKNLILHRFSAGVFDLVLRRFQDGALASQS